MASIAQAFRLNDKVAIIAGAGDTNSRHMALALAEAGANLALVARRTTLIEALAEEIRAIAIPANLTDRLQVDAMAAQVRRDLGRIDILFNHAGAGGAAKQVLDY